MVSDISATEQLAWGLVRAIIEAFDDYGITLHGRIYNQDKQMMLSFVDPEKFISIGQPVPNHLVESDEDVKIFAAAYVEVRLQEFMQMRQQEPPVSGVKSNFKEPIVEDSDE